MWTDTHAHLFEYQKDDLIEIVTEALEASVTSIISTGTNLTTSSIVAEQCCNTNSIYGAAGISPFDVMEQPQDWLDALKELLQKPRMIAVGEIGLDSTNPKYPPLEQQLPFFEKQLELAFNLNIPAVVHSRGSEEKVVEICRALGVKKVLFHCFTGSINTMKSVIDAGYYISFSGIITFKNAEIRKVAPQVPKERLFIETDSPYLTPSPYRGVKNRPSFLKYTGEELARLLQVTSEDLQFQLENNFRSFFTTL